MKTQKQVLEQLEMTQNLIQKVASKQVMRDLMAWEEALIWVLQ